MNSRALEGHIDLSLNLLRAILIEISNQKQTNYICAYPQSKRMLQKLFLL